MEAVVGDGIVVAAAMLDGPVRDGEIIEVGEQGGPPYLVRWSDGERRFSFPVRMPKPVIMSPCMRSLRPPPRPPPPEP